MTDKQKQSMTGDMLFIRILEEPWKKIELKDENNASKIIEKYIKKGYENVWNAKFEELKESLEFVFKSHTTGPTDRHRWLVFNKKDKLFYIGETANYL